MKVSESNCWKRCQTIVHRNQHLSVDCCFRNRIVSVEWFGRLWVRRVHSLLHYVNLLTHGKPKHACKITERQYHQKQLKNVQAIAHIEQRVNPIIVCVGVISLGRVILNLPQNLFLITIFNEVNHCSNIVNFEGSCYSYYFYPVKQAPNFWLTVV